MFSRRYSQKPDQTLISRFRNEFGDIVSKRQWINANPFAQDAMPQITSEEPSLGTNIRGKSHDPSSDANCAPWALRAPESSFSCLDPEALSIAYGFEQQQIPNHDGFTEGDAVFHNRTGEFKPPNSYEIPSNGTFGQPMFDPFPKPPHRDSGYDTMDDSSEDISINFSTKNDSTGMNDAVDMSSNAQFRYNVSLLTQTAMFNPAKEDPVTYLNKGQIYSLVIKDLHPPSVGSGLVGYRTYVRVSFDDKEQRSNPAAYWQLWNDGRAKSEAPRHGGRLHAVEYASTPPPNNIKFEQGQIRLEAASFDGFCVTWSGCPDTPSSECALGVRFNFLSTDFSHSKGVKGASVRLCVKTEMIQPNDSTFEHEPEVSFCKVKLFRDHGAERKHSNDAAHVIKSIEKFRKQLVEAGTSGGLAFEKPGNLPMKVAKRNRKSRRGSSEKQLKGDLHAEIDALQRMFSSVRRVTRLDQRGDEQDDPDLYPVQLGADSGWGTNDEYPTKPVAAMSGHIQSNDSVSSAMAGMQLARSEDSKQSVSLATARRASEGDLHPVANVMKAIGVDVTYRPSNSASKAVACFFVRFIRNGVHTSDYYHAIYLTARTAWDLMEKISAKQHMDPRSITRVFHMKRNGMKIIVDDDVVKALPEGQDMIVEIWETLGVDEDMSGMKSTGTEVKLIF